MKSGCKQGIDGGEADDGTVSGQQIPGAVPIAPVEEPTKKKKKKKRTAAEAELLPDAEPVTQQEAGVEALHWLLSLQPSQCRCSCFPVCAHMILRASRSVWKHG